MDVFVIVKIRKIKTDHKIQLAIFGILWQSQGMTAIFCDNAYDWDRDQGIY